VIGDRVGAVRDSRITRWYVHRSDSSLAAAGCGGEREDVLMDEDDAGKVNSLLKIYLDVDQYVCK
jgi:hypothetical protein